MNENEVVGQILPCKFWVFPCSVSHERGRYQTADDELIIRIRRVGAEKLKTYMAGDVISQCHVYRRVVEMKTLFKPMDETHLQIQKHKLTRPQTEPDMYFNPTGFNTNELQFSKQADVTKLKGQTH